MKLRIICEDEFDFDFSCEADKMWQEKLKEAQHAQHISFSTENDDSVKQKRKIAIPETGHGAYDTARFKCELYSAGGDWEACTHYFRCEIYDGHVDGLSQHGNPHFCFIPGKNEGNGHLIEKDGKWHAPERPRMLESHKEIFG